MYKKTLIAALLLSILLAGCTSYKNIAYMQNESEMLEQVYTERYETRIMPNDLLTITVNALDKEAGEPFNLTYPVAGSVGGVQALQKYLVDNNGEINFPTVGLIKVQGLTRREAEALILDKIGANFKEKPLVVVSLSDFNISVIGEVARPGTYKVENEKINIFQALSLAGDMTIFGMRDNVRIFREHADGTKEDIVINLNDKNLMHSPYYHLQQNDVLYVQPNKAKSQGSEIGTMTTLMVSSASILISIVSLVFNIVKK